MVESREYYRKIYSYEFSQIIMKKYYVVCPECKSEFPSYEQYHTHVFEHHSDQPSLRVKGIVKKLNGNLA